MKIVRIISVVDTREYEEVGDRWQPVPGSGTENECARCGRMHEVHAEVQLEDGTTAVVGTGCMKSEDSEFQVRAKSLTTASKALARLTAQKARAERLIEEHRSIWLRVDALPLPKIETGYGVNRAGRSLTKITIGDVSNLVDYAGVDFRREMFDRDCDTVRMNWKRKRRAELGYTRDHETAIEDLRAIDRKIAKLRKRIEKGI